MLGTGLQAEQVARIVEVADLAAAVAHHPRGADRAGDDAVDQVGVLVLAVDFLVLGEGHPHAHPIQQIGGDV
ncbi:hypothetical protein GALL_545640 [mine drainage metagenome]|uniref:Uncharacterized protein n=1 Tax=mine drainage metagenome TaxID=410659 RepID=A0A1J5PF61_9ZZZZ